MERLRPPRSDAESAPETIGSLPGATSLATLLEAVRSPGVTTADVDALLRGLGLPVAEGEGPRARADLLLSVLDDQRISELRGSDGRSVRAVATQALIELGYPYALELPPEALADIHRSRWNLKGRQVPLAGLLAAFVALTVQGFAGLPGTFELLSSGEEVNFGIGLLFLGGILGPTFAAILGGWGRIRWLQRFGLVMMALTGGFWLLSVADLLNARSFWAPDASELLRAGTMSLGFLLGALWLRHPGWRPPDKPPPQGENPSTE
jgi:hypothetical protein